MIQNSCNLIRPGFSLVLVLCLTSVIATDGLSVGQDVEQNLNTIRLTLSFMERAVEPGTLNYRTNIESNDRRYKNGLILKPELIDLIRVSYAFLTEISVPFAQYVGHMTIVIRAPPCFIDG